MKPFEFRLETLLEFRKIQKEQVHIAFLEAARQLRIEQELLVDLQQKQQENSIAFEVRQRQSLSIEMCMSFQSYFDRIKQDIIGQKQRIIDAHAQYQACLFSLGEAEKSHKIVEKFREKKVEQYQIDMIHEEQKLLDEMGLQIYTKK